MDPAYIRGRHHIRHPTEALGGPSQVSGLLSRCSLVCRLSRRKCGMYIRAFTILLCVFFLQG